MKSYLHRPCTAVSRYLFGYSSPFLFSLLVLSLLVPKEGWGQSSANYTFATNATASLAADLNSNTIDMSTGTTTLLAASTDDTRSSLTAIGFDFFFMGSRVTDFSCTDNGIVELGGNTVGTGTYLISANTTLKLLGIFANDLRVGTDGKVHYKVVGTAPNRTLVIEYQNIMIRYLASAAAGGGTWQVRLYETSGVVEYVYGGMSTNSATQSSVNVGFGTNTTNNTFVTLNTSHVANTTGSFAAFTPTASSTVTHLHSSADGSRRAYTFTAPVPSAPTGLSFTSVGTSFMKLNWTDNASNELGYAIYRSTDNITFTYVTTTAANATNYLATGLTANTLYYWKVYAVSEGALSSVLSGSQMTNAIGPISGNKTIGGATPDYATLTIAFSEINTNGLSGAINLILQSGYDPTQETYPLVPPNSSITSATNTVNIYPAVTGLSITSANTTATFNFDNSDYVTIDGRVNATGTTKDLIVENTVTGGIAVRFINDATNNNLKYCVIKGVNTSATSGVITFSTTTGTTGNDNNTIDNNDIRDGASTPANGLYSSGTTTSSTHNNSNNTISNNNIFNFFQSGTTNATGVLLSSGNTDWTISGNSFYKTVATAPTGASTATAISINNTSGNNFLISGNFIGGQSASAGGSAWTVSAGGAVRFIGINLSVGTTTATSLQNNTIANFSWSSTSGATTAPGVWCGIQITNGSVNVGTVTGNIIGSGTGTGSVTVSSTTTGAAILSFGIANSSSGTIAISNNTIGSMTTTGTTVSVLHGFTAIQTTSGTNTISGNTIGSTGTANSINAANAATSTTASQLVKGILSSSSTSCIISNNTIANLNNAYIPSSAVIVNLMTGISTSAGINTISGNTVRNLSHAANATGTTSAASVIGISQTSTTAPMIVSQNTIHSLSNSHASAAVWVTGFYIAGPTTGTNLVTRNTIHSISIVSTSATAELRGINFASGLANIQNNMIRLGINSAGGSLSTGIVTTGIYDVGSTTGTMIIHNSVYIGGAGVGTQTGNSYAFRSDVTTNIRTYQNNIFVNARSNATTGGKHYAIKVSGTGRNPTGLSSNYNLFNVTGTGGVFGLYNALDVSNIATWRDSTGQDGSSGFGDPNFVNATGDATAVDLHVTGTTPAEASGNAANTTSDDFDGNTRSGASPVDIGADAGSFTPSDIFPPAVSYTALTNRTATNNVLTGFSTIIDNVGVSTGANLPRFYYKKSTDANSFVGNTSADNGWKYVVASNTSSPFSFTIDYSIINGGSVAAGNVIQYFVAAQDDANNLGSKTLMAGASANPPVQNINDAPGSPSGLVVNIDKFTILNGITGSVNVGSGQTYTSLTLANGLFATINSGVLTGNVTANITSDLSGETGANSLNQWNEEGAGAYTLTIQPSGGALRTVTGAATTAMINLNGADRVTIDGLNTGGNALTFSNTSTSGATIRFIADATNNTVQNCTLQGVITSTTNGVIFFSTGTTTGNDNNIIANNIIKDGSSLPANLVYSSGTSSSIANGSISISNNTLKNFSTVGVSLSATGNENWTINGNTITQDAIRSTTVYGIQFNALGTNAITQNTISNHTTSVFRGIHLQDARNTTVSRNRIYQTTVAGSTSIWSGIFYEGSSGNIPSVTLTNNQITLIPTSSASQTIYGIRDFAYSGNTISAYYNSVLIGGTATGSATWAYQRGTSTPTTSTLQNNIFHNNRTGGSTNHFALGDESAATGTFVVGYNLYSGTGSTAANFMDRGTSTTAVSFASWVTAATDPYSWADLPTTMIPGGLTDLYAATGSGDLGINAANLASWYIAGKGVQITGLSADYGDVNAGRPVTVSAGATDIGSDEIGTPGVAPHTATQTGTIADGNTTTYSFAGRDLTSVTWHGTGLPSTVTLKYYSGETPPDPTCANASALYADAYWDITPDVTSGYTFDLTLNYTPAILGTIAAEADCILSENEVNCWRHYPGSTVNTTAKTVTNAGISSFSRWTLSSVFSPLPIELSSIRAYAEGSSNWVEWATASEVNAYRFVVERSPNGIAFGDLGVMDAKGANGLPQTYEFEDASPVKISYYRLRMEDIDGSFRYSPTVVVTRKNGDFSILTAYPSPTPDVVNVDFEMTEEREAVFQVTDLTGRLALEMKIEANKGINTATLDLGSLPAGVYQLSVLSNGLQSRPYRVVKQ